MATRYRCGTCDITSEWCVDENELDTVRTEHRKTRHDGHTPAGEEILTGRRPLFSGSAIGMQELGVVFLVLIAIWVWNELN